MNDNFEANRILAADPDFRRLRGSFNALGLFRFLIYIAGMVFAVIAGVNQALLSLFIGLSVAFVLVMIINYNRAAVRARQQRRAIELGLLTEADFR